MKTTLHHHMFRATCIYIAIASGVAWADTLSLVTSQAAQNANDSLSWASLGTDGTTLGASFSLNSGKGSPVAVSLNGASSIVSIVCSASPCSWTGGGFAAGDRLLWASDAANGGNGPLTLRFSKGVVGAGAMIQADGPAPFTAQIQAYNGSSLLGSYTLVSSSGNAIYLGVNDQSGANITALVFSLSSCGAGACTDFALDTIWFNAGGGGSTASISGQITLSNQSLLGVTVTLSSGPTTTTDGSGKYVFNGLPTGGNVTVTPSLNNYQFVPASQTFSNLSGNSVANFSASPQSSNVGLHFVPVAPCRIADTRNGNGPFGGPILSGGSTRTFAVPSSGCGIPASATAYSVNVTVVPSGPLGYLTLWPAGQAPPLVSTLNSDGRVKANAAIVPAGTGGVSLYVTDATHIILDIDGYFSPSAPGGLAFYPVTPCRVIDTRGAAGSLGAPYIPANGSRSFPVQSSSCGIPSTAQAYSFNYTAVPKSALGFLTTWPSGETQPLVSTLNAPTGTVTANAAIVPAGTNGSVSVYASDATDLIVDMNGYFAPPSTGGLSLYTSNPCRAVDTRLPSGAPPLNGSTVFVMQGGACGMPASAMAYVLNATAVPAGPLGWLTLWPDALTQPLASTLNAYDAAITSNMAIVPSTNGSIDAFTANPAYVILDVASYFAP